MGRDSLVLLREIHFPKELLPCDWGLSEEEGLYIYSHNENHKGESFRLAFVKESDDEHI